MNRAAAALALLVAASSIAQQEEPAPAAPPPPPEALPAEPVPVNELPLWAPRTEFLGPAMRLARWCYESTPEDDLSLATGASGVGVLMIDLYRITGQQEWLDNAKRLGERMLAPLDDRLVNEDWSLDSGVAGRAFFLIRLGAFTGDTRFTAAAHAMNEALVNAARPVGEGVEWSDNPIVNADLILYLLGIPTDAPSNPYQAVALRAGQRLAESVTDQTEVPPELRCLVSIQQAQALQTLATLAMQTADAACRDQAIAQGERLDECIKELGQSLEERWLGPDIGRALWRLHQLTNDQRWLDAYGKGVEHLAATDWSVFLDPSAWGCALFKIPPNVDALLDDHALRGDPRTLQAARVLTTPGVRPVVDWDAAVDRRPYKCKWVTPAMAEQAPGWDPRFASIARIMLRLEAIERGCDCLTRMPDSIL